VRQPGKLHTPDQMCMLTNNVGADMYCHLLLLEMYHNSRTFDWSCHMHVMCKLLEKGMSTYPQQ
jgi:hypothetical protein